MAISFQEVLTNINNNLPALWRFMTAATFLAGFWMAYRGLYQLKEYGEIRTMMASHTDFRRPLITFFIAVILFYWPTAFHVMMKSVFNTTVIYKYAYEGSKVLHKDTIRVAGHIIQFLGFIAFIRGWILLHRLGNQGAQPGTFSKAITHIIGGLLAVNIFGTWAVLHTLMGVSA